MSTQPLIESSSKEPPKSPSKSDCDLATEYSNFSELNLSTKTNLNYFFTEKLVPLKLAVTSRYVAILFEPEEGN